VWVINTTTNQVVGPQVFLLGSNPLGIAITPDGTHAYVTNALSNSVSVIDTAKALTAPADAEVVTLHPHLFPPQLSFPLGIAITPNGAFAYVANGDDYTVSVIDTAKALTDPAHAVVTGDGYPIAVASQPNWGIAITPDGASAYVPTGPGDSGSVSVINTTTNRVVEAPILVGKFPTGIAISIRNVLFALCRLCKSLHPLVKLPLTLTAPVDDPALVDKVIWDFYGDGTVLQTTTGLST